MENEPLKNNLFCKIEGHDNELLAGQELSDMEQESLERMETPIAGEKELPAEMTSFIDRTIVKISEMVRNFGVEPRKASKNIFHYLDEECYHSFLNEEYGFKVPEDSHGITVTGGILLNEKSIRELNLSSAAVIAHELFHHFSNEKVYRRMGDDYDQKIHYGSGLFTKHGHLGDLKDPVVHFEGFNEAVTQYLTNCYYYGEIVEDSYFADELKTCDTMPGAYYFLEQLFMRLSEKIYENNKDEYEDTIEVRNVIVKSYFDGNLIRVGRLFHKLGPDCFRELSELGACDEEESEKEAIRKMINKYGLEPIKDL